MKKIIVIGAGAWGTAIANLLAKNSHQVFLSANHQEVIDEINHKNTNQKFLPDVRLSNKITAIADFSEEIKTANLVFIVIPSTAVVQLFEKIAKLKINKNCGFVICSKGVEQKSLTLLSDAFSKVTKIENCAVLSGPNFAIEVAKQVPTITTIASKHKALAVKVITALNNDYFQARYFNDPRTLEICGIVKNIIAIGCGIIDGLDLGVNAKAALVMKGVQEIQMLCKKFKASSAIDNAAGFGDIFLTCSSTKSRNNSLGVMIAQGKTYKEVSKTSGKTYEGASSAAAISALAKKLKLKLDLCEEINEILLKKFSSKQIKEKIVTAILS